MKRFLPQTLTSQTIFVLLLGLSVSHIISMLIYSDDRVEALTLMGGRNMAQRIANISHLALESPDGWRNKIVSAVSEPNFRVWLTPESMIVSEFASNNQVDVLKNYLSHQLEISDSNSIHVQLLERDHEGGIFASFGPNSWMHMEMMKGMNGITGHQSLRVSLALKEGQWLNFATDIPEANSVWSTTSLLSLLSMVIAVVVLSIWVVRRLTSPLRSLGQAAQRLGKDVNAPSLDEKGPKEIRDAAMAFNEMQARIKRLIENRTSMLAAISHDLRTPITLLRLRTELIEDLEDKPKMLATLDEMEHMIATTLDFARQDALQEERKITDISALLETICSDASDTGLNVSYEPEIKVLYNCQPVALKRALINLVENAVKYGGKANVALTKSETSFSVTVEDNGPGIAPNKLDKVFQPFYRCEESRNKNTGGFGLGLSVTQSVAHAHGGEVTLENKPDKGLRATFTLPL
ncbi:MAG: ATP-binding protein [Alphaproteobacteria bacterium]|nr:ATP-binding protein [Alphaproteobacteria bacterium]